MDGQPRITIYSSNQGHRGTYTISVRANLPGDSNDPSSTTTFALTVIPTPCTYPGGYAISVGDLNPGSTVFYIGDSVKTILSGYSTAWTYSENCLIDTGEFAWSINQGSVSGYVSSQLGGALGQY